MAKYGEFLQIDSTDAHESASCRFAAHVSCAPVIPPWFLLEDLVVKILLVENDPVDAERVLRILRSTGGFDVIHELSLAKAVPVLVSQSVDVALLDLGLSDCDCLEAITALRDMSNASIIVLSGAPEDEVKAKTLERGAAEFLSKSADLELHLVDAIETAVLSKINQSTLRPA